MLLALQDGEYHFKSLKLPELPSSSCKKTSQLFPSIITFYNKQESIRIVFISWLKGRGTCVVCERTFQASSDKVVIDSRKELRDVFGDIPQTLVSFNKHFIDIS